MHSTPHRRNVFPRVLMYGAQKGLHYCPQMMLVCAFFDPGIKRADVSYEPDLLGYISEIGIGRHLSSYCSDLAYTIAVSNDECVCPD